MKETKEMQPYIKKLMKIKKSDKFFNHDEHILLMKLARKIADDGRRTLGYKFQEFIKDNYKHILIVEIIAEIYFNDGIHDFDEIAKILNFYGDNEKVNGGTQRNGQLCQRYMEMLLRDGKVFLNNDGIYEIVL